MTGATTPRAYLHDVVMSASAEQLQLMLYDGAIRFATQGRDALAARDFETSYNKLSRAQAIVLEMEAGLRPEVNAKLCERMGAIYQFVYRKLVEASVDKDPSAVNDALRVLKFERQTWQMLIDKITVENPPALTGEVETPQEPTALCVEG